MRVLAAVCTQDQRAACIPDRAAAYTQAVGVVCTRDLVAAHTRDLAVAFTSVQELRMDTTAPGARASPAYSVRRGDSRTALDLSPNASAPGVACITYSRIGFFPI